MGTAGSKPKQFFTDLAAFFPIAAIFFVVGVHLDVMRAFVLSFEILPIGEFLLRSNPMVEYVREVSNVFVLGVLMAAPFIALNFIVNISFAVLGKAVPKMNVFITSFSVRIMCGFLLLISCLLLISSYIIEHSRRSVEVMLEIIQS